MWMLLIRGTEEQYAGHLIFEGRQNFTTVSLFSNFPVDDGQWHHIVVQRTEVLSLFVDGELQEQSVAGAEWIFDNDEVVQIGGGHCGRYTPGNIGPLTIHNTALFGEGAVDYSPEDSSTATLYVSPNSIFGEYACTWENAVVDVSSDVVTDSFTEDTQTLHSVVEYNVQFLVNGCMDVYACNFDPEAACDDGSCDYTCCPGPGCCDQGLTWNWELSLCQDLNPADINLDGCVQLNDLLDLLSAYGNCAAEELAWQCGDPLEYQGYDYATVQIGEQCWFAENLRCENYVNGDEIPSNLGNSEWSSTISGATAVYEESASNLETYGRLYNWHAVDDARGLCPIGWHVPEDGDWTKMEVALGMSEAEANTVGYRGTDQGTQMKSEYGWDNGGNGTNSSGFSALAGGYRFDNGGYAYQGSQEGWWSSTPFESYAWHRFLFSGYQNVERETYHVGSGFAIRCIQNTE
jgi:uncharacterized protein (TIGR02145 family)